MIYHKHIKQSLLIAGFLFFSACEAPPAFVHNKDEFNRESDFFLKKVTSLDNVIICYHKLGTTPQEVSVLANNECKKFSKRAVFIEQNLQECPLIAPISVSYNCVDKAPNKYFKGSNIKKLGKENSR